jgi:conjugative relaxase-like TrwC/TraI family protein
MHVTAISRRNYFHYLEKESTFPTFWRGKIAEMLDINGMQITAKNFRLLCDGIEPIHGEVLRTRKMHSLSKKGKVYARPARLYDVTINAPRSISILSLVDEEISRIHHESVERTLSAIESLAVCKSARTPQHTGLALYGVWHHQLNRLAERSEHSHIALMNLTYDERKDQWKALEARGLYRAGTPLQKHYRQILAVKVEELGYRLRPDESGWEVEGISPAFVESYSQRNAAIFQAVEEYREKFGVGPHRNARNVIARSYRPPKQYIPPGEVREVQLARLPLTERHALEEVYHLSLREREQQRVA